MNIFLTGGTGFIGQRLVQRLRARDWTVTALVRQPDSPKAQALTQIGVRCVRGDICDRTSMQASMKNADIVIHNAGWYEYGVQKKGRDRMYRINVTGTDNVLGLAKELGITRTVYVSSALYYGGTGPESRDETYQRQQPYHSYYEQTKVEAHQIAQHYQQQGLPLVIVCPNGVVGPNDHATFGYFLRLYLNHLIPPFAWAPDITTSLIHVEDVGEGITLAAERGRLGETYLLAGEPTPLRTILKYWATYPGGIKGQFYIPNRLAMLLSAPLEPLQRLIGLPAVISQETVAASVSLNFSSIKAQRELGWQYMPSQKMWQNIVNQELELLASRKQRDLLSRLRPTDNLSNISA